MSRLALSGLRPGRRTRRVISLLALAVLCLTVVMVFAGAAFAQDEGGVITTSNGTEIQTSQGMEAPELDYTFVWWTFILTFGLLFVYYFVVLRISDTEFKKIIDAHFGPKQRGEVSRMEWVNYVVWAIAILILVWLVIDAFRIETTYDHDLLVSSVEGEIEKEILDHAHPATPPAREAADGHGASGGPFRRGRSAEAPQPAARARAHARVGPRCGHRARRGVHGLELHRGQGRCVRRSRGLLVLRHPLLLRGHDRLRGELHRGLRRGAVRPGQAHPRPARGLQHRAVHHLRVLHAGGGRQPRHRRHRQQSQRRPSARRRSWCSPSRSLRG